MSQFDLELATIEIEKLVATYVGNESAALRKLHGNLLANELELTVSALFMARILARQHMLTGENLAKLKIRVMESCENATRNFINNALEIGRKNGRTHDR